MDLPGHGQSRLVEIEKNMNHSFESCVDDVERTLQRMTQNKAEDQTDESGGGAAIAPARVVVGHSWGGRLALEYAALKAGTIDELDTLWLLDTVPGAANESVDQVIAAVSQIQQQQQQQQGGDSSPMDRKDLLEALTETYGMDLAVAQWLASSYKPGNGDFGFDLKLVKDIHSEFGTQDFVGLLRKIFREGTRTQVHLVRGGRNTAWSVPVLSELQVLSREFPNRFYLHVLPKAGHWVHIDDMAGLVNLFAQHGQATSV